MFESLGVEGFMIFCFSEEAGDSLIDGRCSLVLTGEKRCVDNLEHTERS
jgi:hypothetical protein